MPVAQLKFGDQRSIDYKNAKGLQNIKAVREHECNCDFCTFKEVRCPYCDSTELEPNERDYRFVICQKCGKESWESDSDWLQNLRIIKQFENELSLT